MKHTASVSVSDQQVAEIDRFFSVFYRKTGRKEAAIECKAAIDVDFASIPEAKRLSRAMGDSKYFVGLMNKLEEKYWLVLKD